MRIADVDAFVKPRKEWVERERKKKHNEEYRSGYLEGVRVTLFELQDERLAPTVDAEPVRHGHWIAHRNGKDLQCSECEWSTDFPIVRKYCPNCGSKNWDLLQCDEVSE